MIFKSVLSIFILVIATSLFAQQESIPKTFSDIEAYWNDNTKTVQQKLTALQLYNKRGLKIPPNKYKVVANFLKNRFLDCKDITRHYTVYQLYIDLNIILDQDDITQLIKILQTPVDDRTKIFRHIFNLIKYNGFYNKSLIENIVKKCNLQIEDAPYVANMLYSIRYEFLDINEKNRKIQEFKKYSERIDFYSKSLNIDFNIATKSAKRYINFIKQNKNILYYTIEHRIVVTNAFSIYAQKNETKLSTLFDELIPECFNYLYSKDDKIGLINFLSWIREFKYLRVYMYKFLDNIVPLTEHSNPMLVYKAKQLLKNMVIVQDDNDYYDWNRKHYRKLISISKGEIKYRDWYNENKNSFALYGKNAALEYYKKNKDTFDYVENIMNAIYSNEKPIDDSFLRYGHLFGHTIVLSKKHREKLLNRITNKPSYDKYNTMWNQSAHIITKFQFKGIPQKDNVQLLFKIFTENYNKYQYELELLFYRIDKEINYIAKDSINLLYDKNILSNGKIDLITSLQYLETEKKSACKAIIFIIQQPLDNEKKKIKLQEEAFNSLSILTNKNCGTDIKAWEKVINEMPEE